MPRASANDKNFATYWMHNAFLNIDNKKMSKSLGNFFTVREISEKYDLQVLRFFMLSAHYLLQPLNFSADLMEASKNGLERIPADLCGEVKDLEQRLPTAPRLPGSRQLWKRQISCGASMRRLHG